MSLREELIQQAEELCEEGSISRQDVRRLRLATAFPRVMARIENEVLAIGIKEQKIQANATAVGVNWNELAALIKEIVPLILDLLKLL